MPLLVGFLNPTPNEAAFLVPLFVRSPSNLLFVQELTPADTIKSFFELDVRISSEYRGDIVEVQVGDKGIWAFQFRNGNMVHGKSAELARDLLAALKQGDFGTRPFLESEVANFCEAGDAYRRAVLQSFAILKS